MTPVAPALANDARIVIAGAGSIGCYVGGLLLRGGRDVRFLARPAMTDELTRYGMRLTDLDGMDASVPANAIAIASDPALLSQADLIIVTVKSRDTERIAFDLAERISADAIVLSLQNGVRNGPTLRSALSSNRVFGGMVPFNVVHRSPGHFHRGTSGEIAIEAGDASLTSLLSVEHLPVRQVDDMEAVQWGKLVMNLNNALNAVSGLPLREQLQSRASRCQLADQIAEALRVLDAAKIKPKAPLPIPLRLLPAILRLPTPLFKLAARRMLRIDPAARSSMWEDLQKGRPTEIDHLQAEIAGLAARYSVEAPVTAEVIRLIREAERMTPQKIAGKI